MILLLNHLEIDGECLPIIRISDTTMREFYRHLSKERHFAKNDKSPKRHFAENDISPKMTYRRKRYLAKKRLHVKKDIY